MAAGGGKYDEHATRVLQETNAASVLLIVLGGNKGHGFEHQMKHAGGEDAAIVSLEMCIEILRDTANRMQGDLRRLRQQKRGN